MHDLRLAMRAVWASPIVTAAAVLSLALGIGANTAIFSLVNSLLLRALPVRAPDGSFDSQQDRGKAKTSTASPHTIRFAATLRRSTARWHGRSAAEAR
jgi:hypothetical protein